MLGTRNIIPYCILPRMVERARLQKAFEQHAITEPGPKELERSGFVPLVSSQADVFARDVGNYTAFAVAIKKKVIPASVVNDRLAAKIKSIREEQNREVKGKERRALKDEIVDLMLAQAFVKTTYIAAWIDTHSGMIYVGTSSRNNAEAVISNVREALGSFPAVPLMLDSLVVKDTLYSWLREEAATEQMSLGDECVLASEEQTWTGKRVSLTGTEVSEHLDAGSKPKRLGMCFNDRLEFLLDDELIVRKVKLTDLALDQEADPAEDALGAFDGGLALMAGEIEKLYAHLADVFKFQLPSDAEA